MRNRNGMAIGIIFIILVILFLAGMTVAFLMQGVQKQLEHSDAHLRAQYIAESAVNLLVARLLNKPWSDRWFAGSPDTKVNVSYGGGRYDFFIQDTESRPYYADVWVKSSFKNAKRLFFWRVKYRQSLLGGLSQGVFVSTKEFSSEDVKQVSNTGMKEMTDYVENLLEKRRANDKVDNRAVGELAGMTNARDAYSTMGMSDDPKVETGSPSQYFQAPITIAISMLADFFDPCPFSLPEWANLESLKELKKGKFLEFEKKFVKDFEVKFPHVKKAKKSKGNSQSEHGSNHHNNGNHRGRNRGN